MMWLVGYGLVATRIASAMLVAPLLSSRQIPWSYRLTLALLTAIAACPLVDISSCPAIETGSLVGPFVAETMLGLMLGGGVAILFSSVNLVGETLGQVTGMRWSTDEFATDELGPTTRLLWLIALVVFILLRGPEFFLLGILGTFQELPIGVTLTGPSHLAVIGKLLNHSMWLALHTLGPALAAYYSGILIMGLMGRMLPQLNQFTSGLSVNVLLFWGALFLTTSGGIWVLQDDLPELTGYLSRELAR